MTIRAKFNCSSVTDFGRAKKASLHAVFSEVGENEDFANATPQGNLEITIDQSTAAFNFFEPGASYYLEFTACSKLLETKANE